MISSKDIESLRPAHKQLLDLIYAHAKECGLVLSPDEAVRLLWLTVKVIVEGGKPPHLWDQPGPANDSQHTQAMRIFKDSYYAAVNAHFRNTPELKTLFGAPRKDTLANEAKQMKDSGLSYAQIARRLNQLHGEGTTTQENIRGLLKSRG